MLLFLFIFFVLGLLFGSLATVLIDRWHSGKWWILMWRSECPHCRHRLGVAELIPIASYLLQHGKCKHCKSHISIFYPFAEITIASIFSIISYFFIKNGDIIFSYEHLLLLILGYITWVYILYDLRYMEIPDKILVPGIYWYASLLIISIFYEPLKTIFFDHLTYTEGIQSFVIDHLLWAWILYTFFYIQILLPGGFFLLKKSKWRDFFELLLSYFLFPFMLLIPENARDHSRTPEEDIPTWVWWGDLRVALFIGITLGTIHGIASFAFAYVIGSIFGIIILSLRFMKKRYNSQIPFWPFLGLGWILSVIFHAQILNLFLQINDYL
jgi:prepilin signal peptidase PulO-like enzyme (type II secretory pathway)